MFHLEHWSKGKQTFSSSGCGPRILPAHVFNFVLMLLVISGIATAQQTNTAQKKSGLPTAHSAAPAQLAKTVVGGYGDPQAPSEVYMELKTDGSFVNGTPDGLQPGRYKIAGNMITFQIEGGESYQLRVEPDGLHQLDYPRVYVKLENMPEAIAEKMRLSAAKGPPRQPPPRKLRRRSESPSDACGPSTPPKRFTAQGGKAMRPVCGNSVRLPAATPRIPATPASSTLPWLRE